MEETTTTNSSSTSCLSESVRSALRGQADRLISYYDLVQPFDDSAFYFSEKEAIEIKQKSRELHFQLKAFLDDSSQTELNFPPMSAPLRSAVYLSSKKLKLFTHCTGEGESKCISVYKEERVDDFTEVVKKFIEDESQTELAFPSSLSTKERSKLHDMARELNLHSVSIGDGSKRHLVLSKGKRGLDPGEVNQKCRKLFLTLTGVPIPITTSPLFEYFIDLYQPLLQSKDRFEEFLKTIEDCRGESNLIQHYEDFKKNLEAMLKKTGAFKKFSAKENEKAIKEQYTIPPETLKRLRKAKAVFAPENSGRYLISLDLRSANFNCLRNHDPELVLGCNSWEELAAKATPHKMIMASKFVRQLVMGTLAGRKQAFMWECITARIFSKLIDSGVLKDEELIAWSGDEIVFLGAEDEGSLKERYRNVRNFIDNDEELKRYASWVKVEAFRLVRLKESRFYVKEIFLNIDKEAEPTDKEKEKESAQTQAAFKPVIKCANALEFAQCYKAYLGQPANEYDVTVSADGQKKYFL